MQLRDRLAADMGQFRRKVFRLLDSRDLVARCATIFHDQALAVSDLFGRRRIQVHVGEEIRIRFALRKPASSGDLSHR